MAFGLGLILMIPIASCVAYEGYPNVRPDQQLSYEPGYNSYQDPRYQSDDDDGIPGVAGKDYPILREVPQTGFECEQYQYPGYYADTEANCQAFHICQRGNRKDSFLCPNGTLFNQERLVCAWWNTVDCSRAPSFYSINEAVAKAMEEADRRRVELADERKLFRDYQQESANDGAAVWNSYSQQNGQQEWNRNVPVRHNQNLGLTNQAPLSATTALPVYGVPEITDKHLSDNSARYDNPYLPPEQNYKITGVEFDKQVAKNGFKEPTDVYLPA